MAAKRACVLIISYLLLYHVVNSVTYSSQSSTAEC